jgi:HSP20 family protein
MERDKRGKEDKLEFDLGIGKLSMGGLFKGIEKLLDLSQELEKTGGKIDKEGEIDLSHLKKGMKGVFGFSVKTASGGKPVVESFGNIKKTTKGPTVEEEREPITDVFNEKEEIKIYAEMPGVDKKNIQIDLREDILDISVKSGLRKYRKELLLPVKVKFENITWNYKNGMLEIRIKK